jgi:hypothetical protein
LIGISIALSFTKTFVSAALKIDTKLIEIQEIAIETGGS